MKMLFFTVASFLAIVSLPGQIVQTLQPVYAQLKAYLNLTDTQVQNLLSIQASRNTAQQAIYKQIADKQTDRKSVV